MTRELDDLCITTIRTLCIDAIQAANSGHPGTPVGMAPVTYTLWQRFLRFDPSDPIWPNRDRFVLSAGHASALLWSLLFLTRVRAVDPEYEILGEPAVSLDDLKRFRQLGSKCPGHPEYRWTSGVETTSGPLGQGVATSVGMAVATLFVLITLSILKVPAALLLALLAGVFDFIPVLGFIASSVPAILLAMTVSSGQSDLAGKDDTPRRERFPVAGCRATWSVRHRSGQAEAQPRPVEAGAVLVEMGLVGSAGVVEGGAALQVERDAATDHTHAPDQFLPPATLGGLEAGRSRGRTAGASRGLPGGCDGALQRLNCLRLRLHANLRGAGRRSPCTMRWPAGRPVQGRVTPGWDAAVAYELADGSPVSVWDAEQTAPDGSLWYSIDGGFVPADAVTTALDGGAPGQATDGATWGLEITWRSSTMATRRPQA